ncbi:R3H domain-containing protein 1 isoform X3 [Pseudoliparis swirei]|uniref:R3H domain-containing protein 1 isoform X3 n=1 Tax=Pseudoliparis swirei TaxID=2059687 RepID=UPI0024BE0284|nr:R3H domain-containing protein 1 isoform X3 [Pseudoliparis swirei]
MRMSDTVDTETMKVSEAADAAVPTARDDAADQRQSGGDDKSDAQDGFLPSGKEERAAQDQVEKEDGCDKADKPEKTQRKMLSRDSSQDYTDSTGIDLHEFLVNTLKGNPRDRIMLLKLEQDILDFISNNESHKRKFPPMTSYHRMLLHRVAAYFGMDHNVDPSGKSVVINKTGNTRIPDQKFSEHIKDDRTDDFQKRYILKRDNSSFDRDVSSGDHFILDRSAQDEGACMSTQQRRQMFRLRAGRSGASRQSSSETETLPRHGEPRPWSSTDSSDSSNRLAPRPPITKASSFSGISPCLVRGDSTASSKSTGRLSKTGSESCSSVGSSSSSLSRPQLPLAVSAPSWSSIPSAPLIHPAADARGSGHPEMVKSVPPQPPPPAAAGYYVLPLEASGIPPGSVLVNPHTGKPFIHPDGSAVVYNPAGRSPQQGKTPTQQQPANHLHSQPICPPLQLSSEPVNHSPVSYPLPPLPPPQFLPVCPNQQYTVPDPLSAQFSHMTLAQQQQPGGGGGASVADARHYSAVYHHHHHHASPMMLQGGPQHQQHPQQVASYMVAGPSGVHPALLQGQPVSLPTPGGPNHPYPSSTPGPAAFPGSALNQQLLQQHAYIQQPVQQMSACYCSSAPHPHCSGQQQHYRPPVNPLPYNCPQSPNLPQQQVHHAMMPPPASSYQAIVGMQPTSSLALTGNQQSNMGNQIQGMMVQYPPMQSYQQLSVPQQTYQQPVFVSCQPGQGPVAVAGMQPCYSLLPPNQHTTMSSTVSFLPAQMMEQLQFSQTSAPCVSQQHPGQQYAGLLPSGPGGGGGGGGMVMLQMTAPSCQQPRAPSPCQRKQPGHKHPGPEHQRGRRLAELPAPADGAQSSLPSPPALTPSAGQPLGFKGLSAGISSIPAVAHHPHHHPPLPTAFCHSGPGEAHYSLLGQPLQFKPSIRPPLIHTAHMVATHQGPLGVWRSAHGRKASRKPLSSDLSVGEAVSSQILEVTDPLDSHHLLAELCRGGELIQRLSDHQPRLRSAARDSPGGRLASSYSIFAMLPPRYAAPEHRAPPRRPPGHLRTPD